VDSQKLKKIKQNKRKTHQKTTKKKKANKQKERKRKERKKNERKKKALENLHFYFSLSQINSLKTYDVTKLYTTMPQ
jgi:hypothetical protein